VVSSKRWHGVSLQTVRTEGRVFPIQKSIAEGPGKDLARPNWRRSPESRNRPLMSWDAKGGPHLRSEKNSDRHEFQLRIPDDGPVATARYLKNSGGLLWWKFRVPPTLRTSEADHESKRCWLGIPCHRRAAVGMQCRQPTITVRTTALHSIGITFRKSRDEKTRSIADRERNPIHTAMIDGEVARNVLLSKPGNSGLAQRTYEACATSGGTLYNVG